MFQGGQRATEVLILMISINEALVALRTGETSISIWKYLKILRDPINILSTMY